MDKFGIRFKEERKLKGLTQQQLADIVHLNKSSISRYEKGDQTPEMDTLLKLADFFNVSIDYLLGKTDKKTDDTDILNLKGDNIRFIKKVHESEMVKVPVLGTIKAGLPMFCESNIIDYEYVHQEELMIGEETFYLEVKGDSMINARIHEGDRVRIRKQNFVENNGEIYAVNVNGDEATLKRVYVENEGIRLISENPAYPSMFYPAKDIESGYVNIVGKAVEIKISL